MSLMSLTVVDNPPDRPEWVKETIRLLTAVADDGRRSLLHLVEERTDADLLAGGNMHAVDVAAIPDRFEDAVAETKNQNVLNGLFAEVMIDTINLVLAQDFLEFMVKLAGRLEIAAKRLFDHDPPPVIVFLASQPD